MNILKPGSAFGELELLTKKPRNATILCNDECIFLYLEKKQYEIVEVIKLFLNKTKILMVFI